MGLAVLLGLIAYIFLARAVARAVEKKTGSKKAKYAAIAIFVLIPTWKNKKGTDYFVSGIRGRPRGRSVDSRPKAFTRAACHPGVPKGAWRFTQVRRAPSSWSKSGSSIHWFHVEG